MEISKLVFLCIKKSIIPFINNGNLTYLLLKCCLLIMWKEIWEDRVVCTFRFSSLLSTTKKPGCYLQNKYKKTLEDGGNVTE